MRARARHDRRFLTAEIEACRSEGDLHGKVSGRVHEGVRERVYRSVAAHVKRLDPQDERFTHVLVALERLLEAVLGALSQIVNDSFK